MNASKTNQSQNSSAKLHVAQGGQTRQIGSDTQFSPSTTTNSDTDTRKVTYLMGWNDGFDEGRASAIKEFKKFMKTAFCKNTLYRNNGKELNVILTRTFTEFEKELGGTK
jgi:hypothetical protein